jgi:hypothetical protein
MNTQQKDRRVLLADERESNPTERRLGEDKRRKKMGDGQAISIGIILIFP